MSDAVIDNEDIPFGDDKKYALIVPASISPTGGLIEIEALDGDLFGVNEPSVVKLLDKHNIKTRRDALTFLMIVKSLYASRMVTFLIGNLIYLRLINIDDVFDLYLSQAEKRMYNSLTLEDIFQIHHRVDDYRKKQNGEPEKNAVSLDIRERIIAVANTVIEVSETDLQMFYEQWYYRTKGTDLSPEFTKHWYDKASNYTDRNSGRLFSLIAIECHRVAPEHVDLDRILFIVDMLSSHAPDSHGIHRYLGLCFNIAAEDKKKNKKIYSAYTKIVARQITPTNYHHGIFMYERFMDYEDVPAEAKEFMRKELLGIIDDCIQSLMSCKGQIRNYKCKK